MLRLTKALISALKWAGIAILALIAIVLNYQYLQVKFYHFDEPKPFSGDFWYNPYAEISSGPIKANFHLHASAWGGLTDGHQNGTVILDHYQKHGYDLAVITDYYRVNPQQDFDSPTFIPAYEHGTDINKTHRQVLGASKVDFYDITYSQNIHFKQYLIEREKKIASVLNLNHPGVRHGHPIEYLDRLSGYDCMEVYSPFGTFTKHWDQALTNGKAVWLLANDDCHNIYKGSFAHAWTMVYVDELSAENIYESLKSGRSFGMKRKHPYKPKDVMFPENELEAVAISGDTLSIQLTNPAKQIDLIGQDGILLASVSDSSSISYALEPEDRYVRTRIDNEKTEMLLNPIIRFDGSNKPANPLTATQNWVSTLVFRLLIILVDILLLLAVFRKTIRKYLLAIKG